MERLTRPAPEMTEEEFWIEARRALLAFVAAIERRYDLRPGKRTIERAPVDGKIENHV